MLSKIFVTAMWKNMKLLEVADEVVVDLMGSACGIDFKSAESQIEWHEL